jgi:hypothetical protein
MVLMYYYFVLPSENYTAGVFTTEAFFAAGAIHSNATKALCKIFTLEISNTNFI